MIVLNICRDAGNVNAFKDRSTFRDRYAFYPADGTPVGRNTLREQDSKGDSGYRTLHNMKGSFRHSCGG